MDHVKETKTDKQQAAGASTASSASSCSSSSSASSSSAAQQEQHDVSGDQDVSSDISPPQLPSPDSAHHASVGSTGPSLMESSTETDAADTAKPMDIEQPQQHHSGAGEERTATDEGSSSGGTGSEHTASDAGRMTDELTSSLSSASLTSSSSNPTSSPSATSDTTAAAAATSAPDSSSSATSSTPSSTPSSPPSPTPSSTAAVATPQLVTAALDEDEQRIQSCLQRMHSDIKKGEASVRAILKMLQNLSKAPNKAENRKMRKDVGRHTAHAFCCRNGARVHVKLLLTYILPSVLLVRCRISW